MTMTTHVELLNATRGEIEEMFLAGKAPAEVVRELQEPMPNVLTIYRDLRDQGRLTAQNHPTPTAPSLTQQIERQSAVPKTEHPDRPTHIPNPDLAQRIAGATDLFVKAADIDDKRIQAALGRARKAMTDLAGLVNGWESRSVARSRIARLEAELRIAKAELRQEPRTVGTDQPGGASSPQAAGEKKPLSLAQQAHLAAMREASTKPVDCPHCDKTCKGGAGLNSHVRNAHPGAA